MPYTIPLTQVRLSGVLGTTVGSAQEIWSLGFHYAAALLPAGYDAMLPDVWAAAAELITNTDANGSNFHPDVWLTEVQAASLDTDGKLQAGFYSRYAEAPVHGAASAAASAPLPYQVACTVSLDAGKPAKGRFNRFYLPVPAGGDLSGGMMTVNRSLHYAQRAQVMLTAIEDAIIAQGPATAPLVAASKTHGTNRLVQSVRVGRVLDTIRSRRNNLPEDYQSVPMLP